MVKRRGRKRKATLAGDRWRAAREAKAALRAAAAEGEARRARDAEVAVLQVFIDGMKRCQLPDDTFLSGIHMVQDRVGKIAHVTGFRVGDVRQWAAIIERRLVGEAYGYSISERGRHVERGTGTLALGNTIRRNA